MSRRSLSISEEVAQRFLNLHISVLISVTLDGGTQIFRFPEFDIEIEHEPCLESFVGSDYATNKIRYYQVFTEKEGNHAPTN